MHPIERLRTVARAQGEHPGPLAREAASALAAFSSDPAALLTACRRLLMRQPACGPIWWLAARVLTAADPETEAWLGADELARDATPAALAAALPDDATVVALGWPEQVADALRRRGDVRALVVDSLDEGEGFVRWLRRAEGDAELVPASGIGPAVQSCDLVLLEAAAFGRGTDQDSGGLLAVSGSAAAAATARQSSVPVWAVAGVGRLLPPSLWNSLLHHLPDAAFGWDRDEEFVPLAWVDAFAGPDGVVTVAEALVRPTCPPAPELDDFAPR